MKTIKEAAKAYRTAFENGRVPDVTCREKIELAFENGAKFGIQLAQEWISVEDELPAQRTEVLLKGGMRLSDMGGETKNDACIAYWEKCDEDNIADENGEYMRWSVSPTCYYGIEVKNPTHWRPIEIEML